MIKQPSELIKEAQDCCNCITEDVAKELFSNTDACVIIDVRESREAEQSKLDRSINIPRGMLEMKIQEHCPDASKTIIIHCAGGGRATLAAARLKEMGYLNVHAITAKYEAIKKTFG